MSLLPTVSARSRRKSARRDKRLAGYQWPRISAVHEDAGGYEIDVHCLRAPDGTMLLLAFHGQPRREQVDYIQRCMTESGFEPVRIRERDVSHDNVITLCNNVHKNPGKVYLLPVEN